MKEKINKFIKQLISSDYYKTNENLQIFLLLAEYLSNNLMTYRVWNIPNVDEL